MTRRLPNSSSAELATGRNDRGGDLQRAGHAPDDVGLWAGSGTTTTAFGVRYWEARQIACYAWLEQMPGIVDDRRNDWIAQRNEDGSTDTILDPEPRQTAPSWASRPDGGC